MLDININYFAVILAAVLNMVVGFIWYHPSVFGKAWMKMSGITEAKMNASKKDMPKTYALSALASLITAWVLAYFLSLTNADTTATAVQVAFWAWLGFTATAMFSSVLYESRDTRLYGINAGYHLVGYIVMAITIALWV